MASTASSAERPRWGAAAAWAATPWKRNFAVMLPVELVRTRLVGISGMPRHRDVDVIEEPGAYHVYLARPALFRGRPVVTQRPLLTSRRHPFLYRNCRSQRAGAEQVVTATVSRGIVRNRAPLRRLRFLGQSGQRVEFADDTDHRFPCTERRNEGSWDVGYASLHLEAGRTKLLLQQRATLRFLVPHLREAPDLPGDGGVTVTLRFDTLKHGGTVIACTALRPESCDGEEKEHESRCKL